MHLFGRNSTMITSSNSSLKRSGTPNQYLGVLLHTMAISGLFRVRTELNPLLIVPALRIIQYRRTANCRAMATLAIFRPRRIVR